MIFGDFGYVRKGEFGVWMLLTVEGEDVEFKTGCNGAHHVSSLT